MLRGNVGVDVIIRCMLGIEMNIARILRGADVGRRFSGRTLGEVWTDKQPDQPHPNRATHRHRRQHKKRSQPSPHRTRSLPDPTANLAFVAIVKKMSGMVDQ